MNWYCVEERNGKFEEFGKFQRRFILTDQILSPENGEIFNSENVSFFTIKSPYMIYI